MRIVTAMSGGVDSSVVASLLAEAGHEVIGITLLLHDQSTPARPGARTCCAGQDVDDARHVAERLGIPHYVIDASSAFRAAVLDDFADSYAAGRTPVPCIRCNMGPKFTDLLALSKELGAEALATGHYVRRVETEAGAELHRATDPARDQSWFLFATTLSQLAYCRFPLGDLPDKAAVRAHAARLGLPVAAKPDSQDLCFVPDGDTAAMVARLRPDTAEPGDIVDVGGTTHGRHRGLGAYTVGQARRLGDASVIAGERQIVVRLEAGSRRVVVGPRGTGTRTVRLAEVNWLIPQPAAGLACRVRLRSAETPRHAVVRATALGAEVSLLEPALPAPGQACVLYDGTRVLGGGFIL